MTTRVVGKFVLHKEPAPAERLRRGRAGRWQHIYDAIRALSGGEWFRVPESETWSTKDREGCVSAVRKWLAAHKEEIEGVIVYETVDLAIVIADRRLPAPKNRGAR